MSGSPRARGSGRGRRARATARARAPRARRSRRSARAPAAAPRSPGRSRAARARARTAPARRRGPPRRGSSRRRGGRRAACTGSRRPDRAASRTPPSGRRSRRCPPSQCPRHMNENSRTLVAIDQAERRWVGWPVISAISSKSMSSWSTTRPATSAVAAMMRSGIDGARCWPRSARSVSTSTARSSCRSATRLPDRGRSRPGGSQDFGGVKVAEASAACASMRARSSSHNVHYRA